MKNTVETIIATLIIWAAGFLCGLLVATDIQDSPSKAKAPDILQPQPGEVVRAVMDLPAAQEQRWNVSAYCPCEKSLAQYSNKRYSIGNYIFERVSDVEKVQELWEGINWETIEILFPGMLSQTQTKNESSEMYFQMRELWKVICKNEAHKSRPILFSAMCKPLYKERKTYTGEDEAQNTRVYFCMDAGPSKRILQQSERTPASDGREVGQVPDKGGISTSYQLHRKRQQAGELASMYARNPSCNTQEIQIPNQRVYKKKETPKRVDNVYARQFGSTKWNISAYCPCEKCCGKYSKGEHYRQTANGYKILPGDMLIAAPPEIPFGTWITVPGYGRAQVKDRGGAIKGRKLDLYFDTHQKALNFGRQYLEINIEK